MIRITHKRRLVALFILAATIYSVLNILNIPLFDRSIHIKSSSHILKTLEPNQEWPRIVVTLSSFPGRLEKVQNTLDSLLAQSLKPSIIYLAVPNTVERLGNITTDSYPEFLIDYEKKYTNFKILRTKDYGPSSKLLPALLQESDDKTIIITVDDDVVYHKDTVLTISATLIEAKSKGILIAPTWDCEVWSSILRIPYRPYAEGICPGWVGAYSGAGYWRSYFKSTSETDENSVFNYEKAPAGCKLHDDVWISGIVWRRSGVRPYLLKPGFKSVVSHRSWDNLTIHMVKDGETDYRDPCIKYFKGFK